MTRNYFLSQKAEYFSPQNIESSLKPKGNEDEPTRAQRIFGVALEVMGKNFEAIPKGSSIDCWGVDYFVGLDDGRIVPVDVTLLRIPYDLREIPWETILDPGTDNHRLEKINPLFKKYRTAVTTGVVPFTVKMDTLQWAAKGNPTRQDDVWRELRKAVKNWEEAINTHLEEARKCFRDTVTRKSALVTKDELEAFITKVEGGTSSLARS